MSKSLSSQQHRILVLAAAVNRIKHPTQPDMSVALASVVLGSVGLHTVGSRHTPRIALDDAPRARSVRSTIAKVCGSLAARGLLTAPGWSAPAGRYNLTAAGMALAHQVPPNEVPDGTALAPWLWLLNPMPICRRLALREDADPGSLPSLPPDLLSTSWWDEEADEDEEPSEAASREPTLPRHVIR
jgi:hypothetical protein